MKNNLNYFYFIVCVLIFSNFLANASEFFNFDITEIEISEKIGLSVSINNNNKNKGTITFSYQDIEQLNKIVDTIKKYY